MPHAVHFFLGANSAEGFYSLYEQLLKPADASRIYLLKGGAGCGKSTLITRVGAAMEQEGEQVEYIRCSGDPNSLDGVYLPARAAFLVDATAPHVMEPSYPGVVEQYIDLGSCYDWRSLAPLRKEIIGCTDAYRACYTRAYRCLSAAQQVEDDVRDLLLTPSTAKKIDRRARGILARECKRLHGQEGGRTKRFLGGPTCLGEVVLSDTVEALCKRVYELSDSHGLAHELLLRIADGAVAAGYQIIVCPSPLSPERIAHILIPSLQLGFLTGIQACGGLEPYRRVRFDAMPEAEILRRYKARLRFAKRVSATLRTEAIAALAQAKSIHDELEAHYNPHVDFNRVRALADQITAELLEQ